MYSWSNFRSAEFVTVGSAEFSRGLDVLIREWWSNNDRQGSPFFELSRRQRRRRSDPAPRLTYEGPLLSARRRKKGTAGTRVEEAEGERGGSLIKPEILRFGGLGGGFGRSGEVSGRGKNKILAEEKRWAGYYLGKLCQSYLGVRAR